MNGDGDVVKEEDTFGCKVTIDITKLEMCIVADEVGGNTLQKGDGLVGGELLLTEPGQVAQRTISTKNKNYTLLGLTLLTGQPLMCVLIMAGDTPKTEVETGIDIFVGQIGAPSDPDYVFKNTGDGRRFPGHRLGWTVFTHIQDSIQKKEAEALATTEAKRRQDIEISHRVREVLALQLEPCKWIRKDLECVVNSVKNKDDGPMPKLKKDI